MKHQRIRILFIFFIIGITLLPIQYSLAIDDAIVAIVDDQLITLKDLKDYVMSVHTQLSMEKRYSKTEIATIMKQIEETGLDRLIEDRLVLNAANKVEIEVKSPAVDEKINEIRNRFSSEEAFIAALAADGFTITDLRNKISDQLKSQFFIDSEIKSKIQINPQEITDFYANNPTKFQTPERADVASIFIPLGDDAEKASTQINEAYNLIKSGTPFDDVAKQYSKAPSIGIISRGVMKPEIEDVIFTLQKAETSQPIKNDQGYFLFQLKELFKEETLPIEKVKSQIDQFLFNQKLKEHLQEWFKKQKEDTYIEIKNP